MTDILGATPTGGADANDLVKDATIETFQADVLQASTQVPVIVDFWASWCGPCRTLGPMLEAQVKARNGAVRMVKVDTDKNQMLAQQLRIQSLPTVMAFVAGQPVDGFTGAIQESQISQFIDRVVAMAQQAGLSGDNAGPDPKEILAVAGQALEQNDLATAMQAFSAVVEAAEAGTDEHASALAGMAKCAIAVGDKEQATQMLAMVPEAKQSNQDVAQVAAMLALSGSETSSSDAPSAAADPTDPASLFTLAEAQIEAGDMESAIESLLSSIALDKEWEESKAREKLLTVFEALGATHPAVKSGRRKLSSLLFA